MPGTALDVRRNWWPRHAELFAAMRCTYPDGEDRATGWLDDFPQRSPLLAALQVDLGIAFTVVAFQGYRDGMAGTDWHRDAPFDVQAILSLGASRTLGLRRGAEETVVVLHAGDLAVMPSGFQDDWEHSVRPDPEIHDERISLVFRTIKE